MSNYLTEPEAWREIARRIAEGQWYRLGLCEEVGVLYCEGHIRPCVMTAMWSRIRFHLDMQTWAYSDYTASEERILAALWMALEAEEETP